jgi:hypothetical protein
MRTKRRIARFSPILPTSAVRVDSTVPPAIGKAASAVTSTGSWAATSAAQSLASFRKSSFLATKSVSQLISTIAPTLPSSRHMYGDDPFRRDSTRCLAGLGTQLDAQNLLGLADIASGLGQCALALHHRRVGSLAQLFHHACGNFRHFILHLRARSAVPAAPLQTRSRQPAGTCCRNLQPATSRQTAGDQSSAASSMNSSPDTASRISSTNWLRPSSTASATPRA